LGDVRLGGDVAARDARHHLARAEREEFVARLLRRLFRPERRECCSDAAPDVQREDRGSRLENAPSRKAIVPSVFAQTSFLA